MKEKFKYRKDRLIDLFFLYLTGLLILHFIWIGVSVVEVWHHNDILWCQGIDIGYNDMNYFVVVPEIWGW